MPAKLPNPNRLNTRLTMVQMRGKAATQRQEQVAAISTLARSPASLLTSKSFALHAVTEGRLLQTSRKRLTSTGNACCSALSDFSESFCFIESRDSVKVSLRTHQGLSLLALDGEAQ